MRWILLLHQLPPKPDYVRVKIWRRLQRIGAVAIKNSVYVLPRSDQSMEHFQWLLREINASGGEGSVCEAVFVDGLSDSQIETLFRTARESDYAALAEEADELLGRMPTKGVLGAELETAAARLRRRFAEIAAIDFFGAPAKRVAEASLGRVEARLRPAPRKPTARSGRAGSRRMRNRVWVTRRGVYVDRIASAWLIRRFIDQQAKFRFVEEQAYTQKPGEVRFDMFKAEYTHEGDHCTFETLLARFGLEDLRLRAIAEMVHDLDLNDDKFRRPETQGFLRLIDGLVRRYAKDGDRVEEGARLLDAFYQAFE